MPALSTNSAVSVDTTPIRQLIGTARWLLRTSWGATGLGLTSGVLLAVLVTVLLVDMLVPMSEPFRVVALALVVLPASYVFIAGVVWPLMRRLRPTDVARRIESHIPGMHNRLVSCIDLESGRGSVTASPAFYRRLVTEALERIRSFRASRLVDWRSLRQAALFAIASTAAFAGLTIGFSDRWPTALARILNPLGDIPPVSDVRYDVTPNGLVKVLKGDEVTFIVTVTHGEPDSLKLERTNPGGTTVKQPLEKQADGTWRLTLNTSNLGTGFEDGFTFRVRGGGTWTRLQRVVLLERPSIARLQTAVHFPAYMALTEPKVGKAQISDVDGPEGSQVEVTVQADGHVATGEIQRLRKVRERLPVTGRVERVWFDDRLPAGAQLGGEWVWQPRSPYPATHTETPKPGVHSHSFWLPNSTFRLRPNESLFTYVFLDPNQMPSAVAVQFQDEAGSWQHTAYWGQDAMAPGAAPGTKARIGEVPPGGQWLRLEVPAAAIGLEGQALKGMVFALNGGKATWAKAGAVPAAFVEREVVVPDGRAYAMSAGSEVGTWSGRFPLRGEGLYRVVLRNELGHANKDMVPGHYQALPDQPPSVEVTQPGADVAVSAPTQVRLKVEASDDYGLGELRLGTRRGETLRYAYKPIKSYAVGGVRRDTVWHTIDLATLGVQVGETLRYRVEAFDRRPGGTPAVTKEFTIRVTGEAHAADKQLEAFEKAQDPFRAKLVKLIAEQEQVRTEVEKLESRYAELSKTIEQAKREQAKANPTSPTQVNDPNQPTTANPPLKLDPQAEKELAQLRAEIAKLTDQERRNAALARELDGDLKRLADQAKATTLLPQDLSKEWEAAKNEFKQSALDPLEALVNKLAQSSDPSKAAPNLKDIKKDANQLNDALRALADKMNAMAEAQRNMKANADDAMKNFQAEMERQNETKRVRDTLNNLDALKEAIAARREELQNLRQRQTDLADRTEQAAEKDLPDLEKKQDQLDNPLKDALDAIKNLLKSKEKQQKDAERAKARKRGPKLPYDPDTGEEVTPPKENDTDEPLPEKDGDKKDPMTPNPMGQKPAKKDMDDEDDDRFDPALGPKQVADKRFEKKQRPQNRKGQLQDRQDANLDDLDKADTALEADMRSVEDLINQLKQSSSEKNAKKGADSRQPMGQQPMKGQPENGQPENGQSDNGQDQSRQAGELAKKLAEAMAMLQRSKQSSGQGQGKPSQPMPSASPMGGAQDAPGGKPVEDILSKLDLPTRTVILQMQPKLREELLQGMREQAPEGYRRHVQEYFQRLTEVQTGK